MKSIILLLLAAMFTLGSNAQTAINFESTDCEGNPHNLFTELDEGKVVVLCWVMPCGTCADPAKTSHNIVQSFQTNYKDRVYFYLIDDYANTNCTSLNSWGNSYQMPSSSFCARFSDPSIKMTDYGSVGMPKIVALSGKDHAVIYNKNYEVDATALQTRISNALMTTSANDVSVKLSATLEPNPSADRTLLSFSTSETSDFSIEIVNSLGQQVMSLFSGIEPQDAGSVSLNTSLLNTGVYYVMVSNAKRKNTLKLVVVH